MRKVIKYDGTFTMVPCPFKVCLVKTMLQGYLLKRNPTRFIFPSNSQIIKLNRSFSTSFESSKETKETAAARLKLLQTAIKLIPKSGFTKETFVEACDKNGKFENT